MRINRKSETRIIRWPILVLYIMTFCIRMGGKVVWVVGRWKSPPEGHARRFHVYIFNFYDGTWTRGGEKNRIYLLLPKAFKNIEID